MNTVGITGRLTSAPELKTTPNGVAVCGFCLAVKRPKVKDTTDFINFVVWRQGAEYLGKYGKKGDTVSVSGVLTSRNYEDKNGNKRTAFEVVADTVEIISNRKAESDNDDDGFVDVNSADDLPF